jgi:phosphotransferase system  glucose/maltose/N-acetylglucosamine-specific IIC component
MNQDEKNEIEDPNVKRIKVSGVNSMLRAYAIFSQGLFTMIVLGGLGFFIGYKIDKKSAYPGLFAVLGALIGLVYFIFLVYKNHYFDDKKPDNKNSDGDKNEGQ